MQTKENCNNDESFSLNVFKSHLLTFYSDLTEFISSGSNVIICTFKQSLIINQDISDYISFMPLDEHIMLMKINNF